MSTYISGMGLYLKEFMSVGLYIGITEEAVAWRGNWTMFYWTCWISWTPFMGTFIARISKDRTIREIAIGMVFIPTILITFAMTILGATGFYLNEVNNGVMAEAINNNMATAMFEMIKHLISNDVFRIVMYCIAIVVIAISVLLLGGEAALKTLQSPMVITGLPFSILLIIMMFSLSK